MRHDIIERLKAEQSLSRPQVYRCLKAGMPIELAAAKEWRARSVRARAKAEESADEAPVDFSGEGLEGTVERLREMERALAEAGARAFKEGKVAEATILRREHVAVIKAIYDAESKLIKIDEARGRLISVDRALSMINEALQSAIFGFASVAGNGADARGTGAARGVYERGARGDQSRRGRWAKICGSILGVA